jgi:hypothetical protein
MSVQTQSAARLAINSMSVKPSKFDLWVFSAAAGGALLSMASGLFLGTLGIDDEITALTSYYDAIGRGMSGTSLITFLLPGQIGISFAPMFVGILLYAASIALTIKLWGLRDLPVACTAAAVIGSFPYFAAMMSFDIAQVAYPVGYVLATLSLFAVFQVGVSAGCCWRWCLWPRLSLATKVS